jgi:hypothetical protein
MAELEASPVTATPHADSLRTQPSPIANGLAGKHWRCQLNLTCVHCALRCCACSQKKLGSVSDEITHHALCNTIVIKVGRWCMRHRSCLSHRLLAYSLQRVQPALHACAALHAGVGCLCFSARSRVLHTFTLAASPVQHRLLMCGMTLTPHVVVVSAVSKFRLYVAEADAALSRAVIDKQVMVELCSAACRMHTRC